MAGLRKENPGNLLGVHFDGHGLVSGTIKHGGNLACDTDAARGVLVELALTGIGYDYFWHCVSRFLISGTGCLGPLPL
jgi:hypothetical protein